MLCENASSCEILLYLILSESWRRVFPSIARVPHNTLEAGKSWTIPIQRLRPALRLPLRWLWHSGWPFSPRVSLTSGFTLPQLCTVCAEHI